MRLIEATQIAGPELDDVEFDVSIAASGYESRSTYVPSRVRIGPLSRRFAIGFTDRKVLARRANDKWYDTAGYEPIVSEGHSDTAVRSILAAILADAQQPVKVLFDYTSMTRVWYAGALNFLRGFAARAPRVDVYFTYAPSKFANPRPAAPNAHMGPVPGFSGLELPASKSALLIGLGYEKGRALGLAEYVEAAETFAFYADPALDSHFVRAVLRNNKPLFNRIGSERVFTYPLSDMRLTASKLGSLALGLNSREYRVILAPQGPKPFTFLCFLLATQHAGFDVWRVSAGVGGKTYDRPAIGQVLVTRATFME